MLEALDFTITDGSGEFIPMHFNSELVVITDAQSLQPELERTVISRAQEQHVSIHFILSGDGEHGLLRGYEAYPNIARETGGIVYRDIHSTWSILNFYHALHASEMERRKRSAPLGVFSVRVSRLSRTLRVSTLTRLLSTGRANITAPDLTVETLNIENGVMIYFKTRPLPGTYTFSIGAVVDENLVSQEIGLDASLFYTNTRFTVTSLCPPPACKFIHIATAQTSPFCKM